MVIVFFGTPQFAVPSLAHLIASRHTVAGVVTQPDKPRGRGQKVIEPPVKALAAAHGIPVFQPERLRGPDILATIARWKPDLGVVAAYGKMIPEELLRLPRLGMINVHASLLPKYRGAAPVQRAIIAGERATGVTIMQVARALDAGDMLGMVERPIAAAESSEEVERDLAERGARLLIETIDRLEAGAITPEPQDHSASTYAPRLSKEEGLVDWTLPAIDIYNRVRGLHPWPHAYSYLDGTRVILLRTHLVDDDTAKVQAAGKQPGEVVAVSRDAIHVATGGSGVLAIDDLQIEGRRPMRAREFLAGRPVPAGARFGGVRAE
jgi:methionyl-tRNA formyltransferase